MELTVAGFTLDRRKLLTIAAVAAACVAVALLYRQIDVAALHERAQDIDGALIFVLMTVLPLVGFPVSITHAVAGVRFGLGLGLVLVAASIALQMLASYALVKAAPNLFARHMEPFRKRLPSAAHGPLTVFTMVLPGVPYFAQNYVLPLVGVPLGTYMLWGLPLHIAKSVVGIVFGDMSDNLTPARLAGFAGYAIFITVTTAWAFRRLQAQMKNPQSAASDPKRRA
ncbi:MAG TPA: hypothetical protein VEQ65_01130 [Opitutus sp.]|nr:hypothetical protein [Opitutus sp.]